MNFDIFRAVLYMGTNGGSCWRVVVQGSNLVPVETVGLGLLSRSLDQRKPVQEEQIEKLCVQELQFGHYL